MSKGDKSTLAHFLDLKSLIIHLILVFIISFSICHYYAPIIINTLQLRLLPNLSLHYFSIIEPFFLKIKISGICGTIFCIPILILRITVYIIPTVTKKLALIMQSIIMCILYVCGIITAFYFVIPSIVNVLINSAHNNIAFTLSASSFFSMVTIIILLFGIILNIPIVIFLLLNHKILTIQKMKKFRKPYLIVSFIIGAAVTPPDVLSQIIVGVLLVSLFEMSIICFSLCKNTKE